MPEESAEPFRPEQTGGRLQEVLAAGWGPGCGTVQAVDHRVTREPPDKKGHSFAVLPLAGASVQWGYLKNAQATHVEMMVRHDTMTCGQRARNLRKYL